MSALHVGQPLEALREVLDWQRRRRQQQQGGGGTAAAAGSETPLLQQPLLTPPREWPGLPASALANDSVAGLLHGFDLSGLLCCVHMHKVWGDLRVWGGGTWCGLLKVRVLGLLPCC